ncbi:MAG: hypothetical protein J6Q51_00090, partial [Clostridia bacterium]|nr:hypothetical protein [Clostridia bacterium]
MDKFRRLLLSMLFVLIVFSGFVLSACGANDDNMDIKLSATNIQIVLGENDNTATLTATVTDAKTLDVIVDYDSLDIKVTAVYKENGVTNITVVAYRQCTDVEVTVKGAKKSVSFFVTATTPISSLSAKKDIHYIAYDPNAAAVGGQFFLTQDLVQVYPQDTKQTEVRFSLPNPYLGISIENGNILTIAKGLVSVPNTIDVDAVSVYNETVKASLHFEVVKAIDINQISILDGNTLSEAFSEYEINRTTRSVSLQVVIPFSVHTKELDVKPIFKYNDTGIGWDTKSVEKDSVESVYRYTFEFNFTNVSTPNTVTVEEVWFQISYFEYPEIKTSTLNLMDEDVCKGIFKITKVNEITGIASYVEGVVSSAESLDVYTTYKNMSNGLEIQFETIPTNATARQLNLKIDTGNPNFSFLKVMDSSGKNIEFFGGKHTFMAGEKFYFKAQSGFAENASVDITVESTENPDITRQIKIYLQEGVTAFGFKEGDDLVETHTYYLENDAMSEFFSRTLTFGYSPISVKPEKFTVVVEGDVFESDGVIEKNLVFNTPDVVYYDFTINAIAGKSGQGTLKIKFQSGQEISAKIIVIQKLTDVKIDVDTSLSISSAIGDIAYTDDSLSYVAIKNGQSLPIKFTANAKVLTQTYTFSEIVYLPGFNVYDETGEYGSFDNDNLFNLLGNPRTYVETSNIVRPDLLRTTQTISPTEIGKVWIKISFRGECLKEDYKYSIEEVAKYVCVEIYNPVESIDITSPKNISIYAADEVGKVNAHLSKQYITIELNKNSAYKPTYDKILWSKELITDGNPYKYIAVGTDIEILRIERIENTKYLLTVHTTTIPEQSPITFYSIDVTAPDITGESVYGSTTINISINTVKLVSSITPTNVPAYEDKVICQDCHKLLPIGQATCDVCGNTVESLNNYYIYLKTENISTNLADNKFRILTNVLPDDALNQNVVYEFIPDAGTNPNIIHISADGLVSVNDVVGGSGIIRILPQDALLEDETGRQYYREGAPMALIRVVVADGASRETAILVSSLSEIKNAELHYMLQYGTYETHEFLFDSFSGGLYGTNEFSTNKAVIKLTNTSLFNTISLGAVVENIIICGTATAESVSVNGVSTLVGGLLAKVNNGTVENVEVDLINDNTVSSVTGTATNQYLGGLIGVNYGIIQGSTFAGSVGTAGVVGGLVGANYGTIKQSNVLIYNFKTGASEPKMELSGNAVGGIAGEILGTSTIEQCYVFNFGTENSMSSFAGGALVGKISSKKALVKECFAQIGTTSQFYTSKDASVADSDLKSIIKNSYILIKNGENYSFAYYMTQKNGGYIQGISTETNMLYQNVNFGSNYTWNVSDDINHGYPYLTQVRPVAQITDFSNVKIQKTALSLEEVNKTAVMYLYKEKDMVLTEMESNLLNVANTISLEKLFGLTSAGGVRVTSSNENIISTAVNSITVKNTGVVTLTISSKFDRSIESKEVTVCVLYYTSNLSLTVGSTTIGSDTILHIKANTSQKITSSLKNTVVLLNREIPIMENNYLVNFYQGTEKSAYVVGDRIGTHIISATFDAIDDKIELNVFLSLNLESYTFNNIDTRDTVQEIIKANSLKRIYAQKYYGPNKVTTTIKKATISASDSLVFEVVVNSDNVDETVSHIIFDENNDVVTDLFNVEYTQLTVGLSDTKHSVSITIKRESMKNIKAGDYKFRFVTTVPDVYADVTVTVIAQEVIRVD